MEVENIHILVAVLAVGLFLAFIGVARRETLVVYDEEGRVVKIISYPKWW